jgi:hypothetical protein
MGTLKDCRLAISYLPWFSYNATGGGGTAFASELQQDGRLPVRFNVDALVVPPLNSASTRVGGWLPLPPRFQIDIRPQVQHPVKHANSKAPRNLLPPESNHTAPPPMLSMQALEGWICRRTINQSLQFIVRTKIATSAT